MIEFYKSLGFIENKSIREIGEGHLIYRLKDLQVGDQRYLVVGRISLWIWIIDIQRKQNRSCVLLANPTKESVILLLEALNC